MRATTTTALRCSPSTSLHGRTGAWPSAGASQQDAFTDRELVGFAVTTTDPACNSIINTQPTDFVINLSDAVDPATVQATDFTVNGTPANSFVLGDGQYHRSPSTSTARR